MFMTLTNTNHNEQALKDMVSVIAKQIKLPQFDEMLGKVLETGHTHLSPHFYERKYGKDLNSIVQLGIQGIKGAAAYLDHVYRLQAAAHSDAGADKLADQLQELHRYFVNAASMTEGLQNLLQVGTVNFEVTKLLDQQNALFNGVPQLTQIPVGLHTGPAVLVTGHDLVDLRTLLEKCETRGVNVYTHGEMLPSFMYPELKKFQCLKANFGHAWQLQQSEFASFPGPILFTTNCIMKPTQKYIANCFTTGAVGYEGVKHILNDDWEPIIQQAISMKGFTSEEHCKQVEATV